MRLWPPHNNVKILDKPKLFLSFQCQQVTVNTGPTTNQYPWSQATFDNKDLGSNRFTEEEEVEQEDNKDAVEVDAIFNRKINKIIKIRVQSIVLTAIRWGILADNVPTGDASGK